jgi:hypothetical protein
MRNKVNWFKVVSDLERAGMNIQQQATEAGVKSKTTIFNWKVSISEPAHSSGTNLLEVYKTVIGTTEGI